METKQIFSKLKNQMDQLFANKIFTTVFVVITTVFAAHIAPKLPKPILKLFNTDIFKILFMGFIAYSATKNMAIGLVAGIALVILMQSLRQIEDKERVVNKITESSQITSDSKVSMINNMLSNKQVSPELKSDLINNMMNSIASDKHKFNSGLILMRSEPEQVKQTIDKLYQGVKQEQNKINMTHRLVGLNDKYTPRVLKNLIKSPICEETKAVTIIRILHTDTISPKFKLSALRKIKKSPHLSNQTKNLILDQMEDKTKKLQLK
jgi:energy-converting hydrogenase Eha subunit E